jgi:type VI secretion system protein ImpK
MSGNPFAEPGDQERTVIRPRPGGVRAAPPTRPAAAVPPPPAPPVPPSAAPAAPGAARPDRAASEARPSGPALGAAAAPLLHLLARLRFTAREPDPADLYRRTVLALQEFETGALQAGAPADQVRAAHYALCVSIDDAVLNTPWGGASAWAKRRLAVAFHQDSSEGRRFFDLLARLRQEPTKYLPVIELMYFCLALGFAGPDRQSPAGAGELARLRAGTAALILGQRKGPPPDLSGHWQGVAAPYRAARRGLPVWVAHAAALAACGALFLWVSTALNAASDGQFARMLAAPPGHMPQIARATAVRPPPPPPPEPDALDRLRSALASDIGGGVSVLGTPAMPVIRVSSHGGFNPGGAVLQPALAAVLGRIGAVLRGEPGTITVIGYTDNQPIRTVQFPSNFQLSGARAEAARRVIAQAIGEAARTSAEGRAEADPVASNATPEGREQNRRIEIVLHRGE